jgi:hypothetical protein
VRGIDCSNLCRSPICRNLSNAWEMSRKAAEQYCLDSSASFIACTMRCVWCMVECPCRKPNWWSGSNFIFCTMWRRRSRSFFFFFLSLESLDRPVGCGFVGGCLPGSRIRIIVATFHCIGKYPMSIAALKSCDRYFTAVVGNSYRIFSVMRSYPPLGRCTKTRWD